MGDNVRADGDRESSDLPSSVAGEGELANVDSDVPARVAGGELETPDAERELDVPREAVDGDHVEAEPRQVDADDESTPTLRERILADVKRYFAEADAETLVAEPPSAAFVDEQFFSFDFLAGHELVEYYWVNEPFAFVSILYDPVECEHRYHVSEPVLDEFESYVRNDLTTTLRNDLLYCDLDDAGDRKTVFEREATDVVGRHGSVVESGSLHKLFYYLRRDFLDFGRIDAIMRDPAVEDISCDGAEVPVFVYHGRHRDLPTTVQFRAGDLTSFTIQLAQRSGKQISLSDPLVDASLDDGSRVQLTLGSDISTRGSNFTIRKFSEVPYTPVDLVKWNTFSVDQMAYFWLVIENNRSLVIAGGTGSGKTTSMNAISFFIPHHSKVVSIEDTREITLPHDNWIQSVTRDSFTADGRGEVSMYELLQASLRQRPEYLLVGEIRTEERVALTFFHAIATGHTAYTTVHADSTADVLSRLQNQPLGVPAQLLEGLDVISVQRQIQLDDQRIRRNLAVAELQTNEDGSLSTRDVFSRDPKTDAHRRVNDSRVLASIAEERGWSAAELDEQLRMRTDVLRYLVDNDITDYREVAAVIHMFGKNPDQVLSLLDDGSLLPAVVESLDADAEFEDVTADQLVAYDDRPVAFDGGEDGAEPTDADDEETAR